MSNLDWNVLLKMGCFCTKESLNINGVKYIVKDRIAEGGFSLIDLVENRTTRKKYALKRITCHGIEDQQNALREIELGQRIKHKNVIEIVDHSIKGQAEIVSNQKSYVDIVLPYYRNGTLQDQLLMRSIHRDFYPEFEILRIFMEICEGVRAMHESQPDPLAHRDLKVANICMSDTMEPIIVDLGSTTEARVQICGQHDAQQLQDIAEEKCSIVYRAPELFSVESYCMIDERTDIWSLGCVLYAMCFFKCPFDAVYEKGDSVALAVLSGNIIIPDDSPYTKEMHELIMYMLRINPMERPYIYSVIEKINDLILQNENKV